MEAVGFDSVQARIQAIQSQLAALAPRAAPSVAAAAAPTVGASSAAPSAAAPSFAAALETAVTERAEVTAPGGDARTPPAAPVAVVRSAPPAGGGDGWVLPVSGRISSHFGPRRGEQHTGLDIAVPVGTPVRAATAGVVKEVGWRGGYGKTVVIEHAGGVSTLYAHNSELRVSPGQRVRAGDVIAAAGSTGRSTGPHLHLEVRVDGEPVDPLDYLRDRGVRV